MMIKYAQGVRAADLSLVDMASPETDSPAAEDVTPPVVAPVADPFSADAEREFLEGHVDEPLWARALAQAGGNEKLARQAYLRLRAAALRVEKRNRRAVRQARRERVVPAASGTRASARSPKYGFTGLTLKQIGWLSGILSILMVAAAVIAFRPGSGPPPQRAIALNSSPPASESASSTLPKNGTPSSAGPEAPRRDYAGRIRELKEGGNWNVVVLYAAEWARTQPKNAEAWKELSAGYLRLRQFNDAFEAAGKAVETAPQDAAAWRNLGQVNAALDDAPAALAAFERAASLDPQDVASLVQVGTLNMRLGRLAASREALARAFALSPGDTDAQCAAVSLAQREGRAKDAEAMLLQVTSSGAKCRDPNAGETASVSVPRSVKPKAASETRR